MYTLLWQRKWAKGTHRQDCQPVFRTWTFVA
jgi:hypothetical protein